MEAKDPSKESQSQSNESKDEEPPEKAKGEEVERESGGSADTEKD